MKTTALNPKSKTNAGTKDPKGKKVGNNKTLTLNPKNT